MTNPTILQIVKIDETGDSCYRMRWPARAYAAAHPHCRVINLDAGSPERYEWARQADLLVLFQCLDPDMFSVIDERRNKGLKTLVEYNDNFYNPQAWSPVAKEWESHRVWDVYERFMQIADGVLVTGQGLFDLFRPITTKPIHILENNLPSTPASFNEYRKKKTPYPSFGWAGSLGHMADLLGSTPIINQVLESVPGSKFHVMGNESIPKHLQIPPDRIVFTKWGTMEEYFSFWESVHVGFAPLLDTRYNQCRSDIKAVEMSSRAVAPVLCNTLPYRSFISSTGIESVKDYSEAASLIIKYLHNTSESSQAAEKCYGYVVKERFDTGIQKRASLYNSMFSDSCSDFNWPIPPGYHEIVNTSQVIAPSHVALKTAQDLLKEKKGREALDLVTQEASRNPHAVELAVASLQLLRAAQDSRFETLLVEARGRFPKEPRLWILHVQGARGKGQHERWREFFIWLRTQSQEYIRSVGQEVSHAMAVSLTQDSALAETAEELLLFYPFAYQIRFQVAEAFERMGRIWEARAHFETLCRAKREYELGGLALAALDRGYMQAWYEAIDARIKGDFS